METIYPTRKSDVTILGISATFLNNLEAVLSRPSGDTETGGYYLTGFETGAGQSMGAWVHSISRSATPVSVSIDTSVTTQNFCAAPSTDHLTQNGFHAFTTSSGASGNAMNVGGAYTIHY